MRIVFVSDFGDINGGAAKVAILSARGLADAGIPVIYVCAVAPVSPLLTHPLIDVRCLDFASVWTRSNALAAASQGIWHGSARTALDKILGTLSPAGTIVHFHQWTKAFSPSVLSAPARRGLPSVVSLHDYFLVCPNGAYYRYAEGQPCAVRPLSASCLASRCDRTSSLHKAVRVLRQAATARALSQAGPSLSVVNVSSFAERIVDPFIPQHHPRFVLRSPVAVEHVPPVRVADNRAFVFAGRLTEEKGIGLLATVARDAGIPLTIAGDGPLLKELQRMGGSVRCTGWLDEASLTSVLRSARALVFPSTWYETGGLIVPEALAQGIPVIVSRNTGAAEFVEDGGNGFIVDANDAAAMRARMVSLQDGETAAGMGAEAYRRYWCDPATPEAHTRKLLAIYDAVLARHHTDGNLSTAGIA